MSCNSECKSPSRAQAHCSVCHRTFSGAWAFDEHRDRRPGVPYEERCLEPGSIGLREVQGIWRREATDRPAHWA